jgi:uncharacterized membrane protein
VKEERMSLTTIEKSIEVNVPAYVAYSKWMRFEDHPRFMQGVKEVKRLDVKRFHWKAHVAGQDREWDAEITDQKADQRLALMNQGGPFKGVVATFHELSHASSKIMLQIEYDPQGVVEHVGQASDVVSSLVQGDLERFKGYLERGWVKPDSNTIFDNFPM